MVSSTKGGFLGGLVDIAKKEGVSAYWKGNIPQLIRILPYSATQLSSYEFYKSVVQKEDGSIPLPLRLVASACAGMTATTVTYPLDIIRLRMVRQTFHVYSSSCGGLLLVMMQPSQRRLVLSNVSRVIASLGGRPRYQGTTGMRA